MQNNKLNLDVEKSWIENQPYLQELVKTVKSKSIEEIDSNLAYEVAYASTYISIIQSKSSTIVDGILKDCKTVFDMVLSAIPYEKLQRVSKEDYTNLLKCRYDNVYDASYEKSYSLPGENGVLHIYLKKVILKLVILGLCVLGAYFWPNIRTFIFGSEDTIPETIKSFYKACDIVVSLFFTFAMFATLFIFALDIMYIMLPFVRAFMHNNNSVSWVSSDAVSAVEQSMNGIVVTKKIKDFDRIERNKEWLNAMIGAEKQGNGSFIVTAGTLAQLKNRIETSFGKNYYLALSQVEFLHDEFIRRYN